MSRMITLGLMLVFGSQAALADHWISVGSFKNRDMAEKGLVQAQAKTSEPLSVVASDSSAGINYRVSAGPYATIADAKRVLPVLSRAGLSGAWIWRLKRFVSNPADSVAPATSQTASSRSATDFDFTFPELNDVVLERELRAAESMRAERPQPTVDEVPEQAPPGYQLHRLRRD